ncbi:unnamed protein product [Penicillium roqueforti FM164]|uniref:Genomic scaffold, ProqFM164S03 n=1 Tax=Penicillium roqueforti (strain FM164) TaxID=1365484 RepID=W6QAP8_PENRF|nr:unnamed protein product [Penicillium roqueforti FM164]
MTHEAIGSEANAIRRIRKEQEIPFRVIKYLRFTNAPPAIAEEFSLSSTRHMFNHDTRSMIIKQTRNGSSTLRTPLQTHGECRRFTSTCLAATVRGYDISHGRRL